MNIPDVIVTISGSMYIIILFVSLCWSGLCTVERAVGVKGAGVEINFLCIFF